MGEIKRKYIKIRGFFGDEIKNRRFYGGFSCFGGGRWIRTIEARRNRFTVCPLWPLGNPSGFISALLSRSDFISIPRLLQLVNPFFAKKQKFIFIGIADRVLKKKR